MIFSDVELVQKIISGEKTSTVRLKKEGESFSEGLERVTTLAFASPDKWRVGGEYSVQLKRGGKGLKYCSKCLGFTCLRENNHTKSINPLRVRITSIREIRLLDITEEETMHDGFRSRENFIKYFQKVNKLTREEVSKAPPCWLLEFEVVK